MFIKRVGVWAVILLAVVVSRASGEQSVTYLNNTNSADAFFYNGEPNNNYANSQLYYYNNRQASLYAARSILRFDLPTLPAGAEISSVSLSMRVLYWSNTTSADVSVHQMLTDWNESEATWNNAKTAATWAAGAFSASDYNATAEDTKTLSVVDTYSPSPKVSWDITALYQNWLATPAGNYGLTFIGWVGDPAPSDPLDGVLRMANSEYSADTYYLPEVVIDWTYHPGDANGDGLVNLADLQILGDNWQSSTAAWAEADFTDDGIVNLADLQIIGDNWDYGAGPDLSFDNALESAGIAVPEPASATILIAVSWLCPLRRRQCEE
ncbi:MAG: DNRLRE domain-containing protein [Phycisphaeraceae bacterium]|nr:DNRLRE domain-containing protein [Phycisphaeraceae bacterium]